MGVSGCKKIQPTRWRAVLKAESVLPKGLQSGGLFGIGTKLIVTGVAVEHHKDQQYQRTYERDE